MKLTVLLSFLLFVSLSPLHAICALNLRQEGNVVRWDPVPGATQYWVQESFNGLVTSRNYSTKDNSAPITHRASVDTAMRYAVTAEILSGVRSADVNSTDACRSSITVTVPGDPEFRALTRKAVLPVVGSTAGSFGGRFRTSLVLRGARDQKGRIVFHPAGQVASDGDPSIAYGFTSSTTPLAFDDIVASIGRSGIGSIDIVPDEDSRQQVPQIEARLYNDTSLGTFGTLAPATYPIDYLQPLPMEVTIPDERFRVNVGLRTLTATTVKVLIYSGGRLRDFKDIAFPAGWMQMTSAADFARATLVPGDSLTLLFTGSAIPFYTITENRTNDPTLVLGPVFPTSRDVNDYID